MKVTNTILLSSNLSAVLAANYNQIPKLKGAHPAAAADNKELFYDDAAATTSDIMPQVPSSMPSVPSNTFPVIPHGEFALQRTLVELPDQHEPQFFWHCLGGSWNLQSRFSIFTPNVIRDIDTSTWDDPPQDWNQTINANVTQTVALNGVTGNGVACSCKVFHLDVGQWLSANAAAQSSVAIDTFQSHLITPANWFSTDYLSPDADTSMIEQVYEGETLFSSSHGFVQPDILTPTEPQLVTNNKFLRIKGASPSEGIVLRASSESDYGVNIYLVEESSAVDYWVRTKPIISVQTSGREIHLDPVPQGHYYTIIIQNPNETGYNFDPRQPPYQCTFNEYGLVTKYDVTYSTSSDHNASTKKDVGCTILLATAISIAASILHSF